VIGWDPKATSASSVLEVLCESGRWGQKRGGGYYDYDERRNATPSPVAERIIRDFSARNGGGTWDFRDREIIERLLYPVVNEGARILEEGIAIRASDIDLALVSGYGWPVYTGGPMFWADTIGLDRVLATLEELHAAYGDAFKPAGLLRRVAKDKGRLHDL
jgi:3-hydroxyacyl-CoA dehydrogenase